MGTKKGRKIRLLRSEGLPSLLYMRDMSGVSGYMRRNRKGSGVVFFAFVVDVL